MFTTTKKLRRIVADKNRTIDESLRVISAQNSRINDLQAENQRVHWEARNPCRFKMGDTVHLFNTSGELECYRVLEVEAKMDSHTLVQALLPALARMAAVETTALQIGTKAESTKKEAEFAAKRIKNDLFYWHICLLAHGSKDFTKCFWLRESGIPDQKKVAPQF